MQTLLKIAPPRHGGLRIVRAAAAVILQSSGIIRPLAQVSSESIRWSSSNARWKQRQRSDYYAQAAKAHNLKGRAAFKLIEMDSKYKLFKRGQTVLDLGYAPGSWSQVAVERTKPNGRIIGIDIIPAQPPKGVSTIQGNFLSPGVQNLVKDYLVEYAQPRSTSASISGEIPGEEQFVLTERPSYIDAERAESTGADHEEHAEGEERLVDLVLSDMLMNTSGMPFRDHAGSMDLCLAALQFASDTLRAGGHFVCKFYQGSEDKSLELKLKKMFGKVHREKPDSSRSESKEAYFVALRRKGDVTFADVET
ncbi:ribosomal RNA methyltransferase MRM2 [Whalleya microplaca]|nr:ribosomal RNA methyltransferase MRM2 [Whalleya microplaca]